jgi:hypothetical protein
MQIKIINETGVGFGTKIINARTGEEIAGIREVEISFVPDEKVVAELTFFVPSFDVFAIAKLSEKTKEELRWLRELLESIDVMEEAQKHD